MNDKVKILLAGIGGYGEIYVHELLPRIADGRFVIVGLADPRTENCKEIADFRALGVPEFASADEFYARGGKADLAIISSPIQFHAPITETALANGSHVLCEKPVAATLDEVRRMIAARDAAGRFTAIGYQWSFTDAVQALKDDIRNGVFGRPKRMRCMVLWPRGKSYFARSWAARIRDAEGRMVLDSVANNATAHYLHNMLYLLGPDRYSSVRPKMVQAELYRANRIENFDTAAMRIVTENNVELLFLVTHAVMNFQEPLSLFEFERAAIAYEDKVGFLATFRDGSTRKYGDPNLEPLRKLWRSIDAVRTGEPPLCGLEAAASQTMCIAAAHASVPDITDFPADMLRVGGEKEVTWAEGLEETLRSCYHDFRMPNETGAAWSKPGRKIDLSKEGMRL